MLNGFVFMYVGVQSMEGLNGRLDCSYEEQGGWLSPFKHELDIVREVVIDNSANEEHNVGSFLPSIPVYPIVECFGLSRLE